MRPKLRSAQPIMQLHTLDWIIALLSVAICFAPALFFGKRSGKSTAEIWWLAGLPVVATRDQHLIDADAASGVLNL